MSGTEISQPVIDTREELINSLIEAAELEHGLLIQYLFAAYSLKKRPSEGITWAQLEKVRDWERAILVVARQEMAHLGNVCNLLTAIGGAPRFGRRNMPQSMSQYYPFDFQLERFNEAAIDRFITFEKPLGVESVEETITIAPDPVEFNRVGELYIQIADGFQRLDQGTARLFIGAPEAQDFNSWTMPIGPGGFNITPVTDLASALAAIDRIILEGEGAPGNVEGSHYDTFIDIRESFLKERETYPDFDPARPVARNPLTRTHRDSGPGEITLLEPGTPAHATAELFNHVYGSVLLMLMQFYDFGGETQEQRVGLQSRIRQTMSGVVRPLAEVLTELPVRTGAEETAGPGFEIYAPLQLPGYLPSRWTVLVERLQAAAAECRGLAGPQGDPLHRLDFIETNLTLLTEAVAQLAGGVT